MSRALLDMAAVESLLVTLGMIARTNRGEKTVNRVTTRRAATNWCFNTGSITPLGSSRWNSILRRVVVTAAMCTARNIIGYAALVVCLFAAYLRAPTIKSKRKTWMECRNDERQCILAEDEREAPAGCFSLVLRHPRRSHRNFFLAHELREGDRSNSGRNLLISCRLRELRK